MASLGVLSRHDKEAARRLLLRDMDLGKEDQDVPPTDR